MEIDEHAQELVGMISAEAIHDERQSKLRGKAPAHGRRLSERRSCRTRVSNP